MTTTQELPAQERRAFLAWVADCGCDTDGAWSAWQARARLAAQVEPQHEEWLKEAERLADAYGTAMLHNDTDGSERAALMAHLARAAVQGDPLTQFDAGLGEPSKMHGDAKPTAAGVETVDGGQA